MEKLRKTSPSPESSTPKTLEELVASEPLLGRALSVAKDAHSEKTRDDGTPYINHCIEVARIAYEEWGMEDPEKLSALLLHDTVEDSKITLEYLNQKFGKRIASWVDGLTKFETGSADLTREEKEKITYKKIVERNLLDLNVGVFKLADNLHNMRTLSTARPDKRQRNAQKTLNVFAPLAESLGMWIVKTELENLALEYADPEIYKRYSNLFNKDVRTSEEFKNKMKAELEQIIKESGIYAEVSIRENSLVRLKDKKEPFEHINDVESFRIRVMGRDANEKRDNCYKLEGIMREKFGETEDQSRIDDFYANPKFNGYSAIQLTLDFPVGAVEIAITSDTKEDYNNWGILSLTHVGIEEIQEHVLKIVITPTGQSKFLPTDANGLDYAYLIDKKLAAQAVSITINGEVFSLDTIIPNGADVKINRGPDRIAPDREVVEKSRPQTKKKAEKQFLEQKIHNEEAKGKEIASKIIFESGLLDLYDLTKLDEHADKLVDLLNYSGSKKSLGTFYRLVKYNVINEKDLRDYLEKFKITKKDLGLTSILIEGIDKADTLSYFSKQIAKGGGNIRWEEGGSHDKSSFSIRCVVEDLKPEKEAEIREKFQKRPKVTKILVV